jgi:acyl carrier protein
MSDSLKQKLFAVIAKKLSLDTEQVNLSSRFQEDLGADSLDIVELLMALEEEFSVDISDGEAEKIQTVADALKIIESKLSDDQ